MYDGRKSRQEIVSEYELTAFALDRWIAQFQQSGSFKEKDNRSPEEQELKENILTIFSNNRKVYGSRRIKDALSKVGYTLSRRRLGIQSKYAQGSYKPMTTQPK